MKTEYYLNVLPLFLLFSQLNFGQIISQYIETSSGTTPKGIEIWNNTANSLDFSTNNLVIEKGSNGAVPVVDFTINSGVLTAGDVLVIGSNDLKLYVENAGASFFEKNFSFNGDDALVVKYGGIVIDVFGDPGTGDPGAGWTGSGVQTFNQNISLKSGITTGDTDGWTDPSSRFEITTTDDSIDGFGFAPGSTKAVLVSSHFKLTNLNYTLNQGPSSSQNFILSGVNTNNTNVIVTASTYYEVSKDNSSFSNSITFIAYNGNNTPVYVRLKSGLSLGDYNNETVSITGGGDSDGLSVNVSGSVTSSTGVFHKITSLNNLENGWYVITNQNDAVAMTNVRSSTTQYDALTIASNGNAINNPTETSIWYIRKNEGYYTIYSEATSKFVGWSSSTTLTTEDNVVDNKQRWIITYDVDHFVFTNVDDNTRLIRYNNGLSTPGFKAYTSSSSLTNSYIQLYKKQVTTSTWNGTSSNWDTPSNWDNGVPTTLMNAIIPSGISNNPVASSTVAANNITIHSGASLEVLGNMEVSSIIMSDGASFIPQGTVSGTLEYTRSLSTANWYLMSSPVVGNQINSVWLTNNNIATGAGNNRGIGLYLTISDSWAYQQEGGGAITLTSGKGYAVKKSAFGNVSFSGTLHTDATGVNQTLLTTGNRFNLLGNPYTSYINSATFLQSESAISDTKTIWIWNQALGTNGAYEVKIISDNFMIAPSQGFFVQANNSGGIFNFSKSNRSHISTNTFQKNEIAGINLTISNDEGKNYTKIYYSENATDGVDVGYDGELFGGISNTFAIYSHLISNNKGKKYQVQSIPKTNLENMIVPIGVDVAIETTITFSAVAFNFPENIKVFLEDRLTNVFTEITSKNYTTTINEKNGSGRFYIHTKSKVLANTPILDERQYVSIYKSDNHKVVITGLIDDQASLSLYDSVGKKILTKHFVSSGESVVQIPETLSGVYLVQLVTKYGKINKKLLFL